MPTIDYNQLSALPLTELTFPEPSASAGRSDSNTLFDEYLKRANSVPTSTAPATDNSIAKPRETDRPAPPKSENASPAKPSDAATPKNESRDEKPSNAASSPAEENRPAEPASDSTKPRDAEKPQNGVKETEHDESKEDKVEPVDKVAIKDKEKKKNKEDKDGNQQIADAAAAQKAAEAIPAMENMQTAQGEAGKKAEKKDSESETESSQEAVATSLQLVEPSSAKAKNGKMRATTGAIPGEVAQTSQEHGKATVQQAAAENPAEAMLDVADDGKAKTKKIREAVAEAKSIQRKHNLTGEQTGDSSGQTVSDASAPVGDNAGNAANTASAASQASASVMQSVLEVLKNAEKPTTAEDAVAPTVDARANSGTQSTKTTAAREGTATTAPGSADNSGYALRVQFVQRVERAFAAMGSREGSVRLKLSPPELGILKLEIGVSKGVMKARVEAETPAAKSLLLDNLPELRERLAQQNINIQQFDVDLMDRSTGGMHQQTFDQSDSGSRQQNHSSRRTDAAEAAAVGPAASTAASQRSGMGGGLNIIV